MGFKEKFFKQYAWTECYAQTNEGPESMLFFDWDQMVESDDEILEEADSMSEDEASEFLSDASLQTPDFFDYYTDEYSEEKVKNEQWHPIAAVGLYGGADSIAEMGNRGFFAIVNSDPEFPHNCVIWYFNGKAQVVAPSFERLVVSKHKLSA